MSKSDEKSFNINRRVFLHLATTSVAAVLSGFNTRPAEASTRITRRIPATLYEDKFSICDMCFNQCALIARVRNGIVEKLDPHPGYRKSGGMLCAKGNAGLFQLSDPDRLKYPLLRKGRRGEGRWQRLTWDQALDYAAMKIEEIADKYSRCGLLLMTGSDIQSRFMRRFAEVFGTYNYVTHDTNCLLPSTRAYVDTFGQMPFPDVANCKYILLAGANLFESIITPDTVDLVKAMKSGCKMVCLDPRYTKTAALADEWYQIRPGTDMAFMLAVANVFISDGIYNRKFVKRYTAGFKRLSRHVRNYTSEWAEHECDIPASAIRKIAHEMAEKAPEVMVYPGRRSSSYVDSTQISRSCAIVNALLGNWDIKGGLIAPGKLQLPDGSPYIPPFYEDNPPDRVDSGSAPFLFYEDGSFKHTRDAIIRGRPYPVKGFITYKTNPMQSGANQNKTLAMINKLDFMMVIDIAMTDTAFFADLVLPSQSYLERKDPCSVVRASADTISIITRNPAVQPYFESKSFFWIIKNLACRLGLGKYFDFTMDQYRNNQLKELPGVLDIIETAGKYDLSNEAYGLFKSTLLRTETGKIDLWCGKYKKAGLSPLPVYKKVKPLPDGVFRMVIGRNAAVTHTSTQNNPLLNELNPVNRLWINDVAAKKQNIAQDDYVEIKSAAGGQRARVRVTPRIRQDTVYMLSGYGSKSPGLKRVFKKGANMAVVLEDMVDEITGSMAMHETLVTVRKISL